MEKQHSNNPLLQVRFLIACPKSSSTLVMRIFAEAPSCSVTSRLILMGNHGTNPELVPDYTILDAPETHKVFQAAREAGKLFLVNKEELGNDTDKGECTYNVLPTPSAYDAVKPVFLVRDPIRVFDSWKFEGWEDINSLFDCYNNIFRMLSKAKDSDACLLYERLTHDPDLELHRICARWGITLSPDMLDFKHEFGSGHISVQSNIPSHNQLSNEEKTQIEAVIGRQYVNLWGNKLKEVRESMMDKEWFAFDLDDTLHEFRKAAGAAVEQTLLRIRGKYVIRPENLNDAYKKALVQNTSEAFIDGKTSFNYRPKRFSTVLLSLGFPAEEDFLDELLKVYEKALKNALELKCGAMSLIKILKFIGKKIAIITEGPQDAQERTLKVLGLEPYVDFLATSNVFRASKTEGFFPKVLESLKLSAEDMVYIGDNYERDMVPAMQVGIYCVHFAEQHNFSLDVYPIKINTLKKLEFVLASH